MSKTAKDANFCSCLLEEVSCKNTPMSVEERLLEKVMVIQRAQAHVEVLEHDLGIAVRHLMMTAVRAQIICF